MQLRASLLYQVCEEIKHQQKLARICKLDIRNTDAKMWQLNLKIISYLNTSLSLSEFYIFFKIWNLKQASYWYKGRW